METNNEIIIAIGVGTIGMGLLTVFVFYFVLIYRKKQRAFEWEREDFKQALLQTEIEIKEQTLSDISRELHDNLGQMASLIKINLNLVLPKLEGENHAKITESLDLLKLLIQDIKSLSVSLKGENLARFGLLKMIEKDLERYKKMGGLSVVFTSTPHLPKLDPAVEIFVYRMSQEIFNNILRHSQATEVHVSLTGTANEFSLQIKDNGKGFESNNQSAGSGLVNLKERCQIIGAELNIDSKPQKGTSVLIKRKLKNE